MLCLENLLVVFLDINGPHLLIHAGEAVTCSTLCALYSVKCNKLALILLTPVLILHLLPSCHCSVHSLMFCSRLHMYCLYTPAPSTESTQII